MLDDVDDQRLLSMISSNWCPGHGFLGAGASTRRVAGVEVAYFTKSRASAVISGRHLHELQGYHSTKTTAGTRFFEGITARMAKSKICPESTAFGQAKSPPILRVVCGASYCQVMNLAARHRHLVPEYARGLSRRRKVNRRGRLPFSSPGAGVSTIMKGNFLVSFDVGVKMAGIAPKEELGK